MEIRDEFNPTARHSGEQHRELLVGHMLAMGNSQDGSQDGETKGSLPASFLPAVLDEAAVLPAPSQHGAGEAVTFSPGC